MKERKLRPYGTVVESKVNAYKTILDITQKHPSVATITVNDIENIPFWDFISLANYLEVSPALLRALSETRGVGCYRTFYISKKTGKPIPKWFAEPSREINSPLPGLKAIQSKLAKLFSTFKFHDANSAFIAGRGIMDAVNSVKEGEVLIHCDIEKCFDNHSILYVKKGLAKAFKDKYKIDLDSPTINALAGIACRNNCLPQGSPLSPILVVILNYELDKKVEAVARKYKLVYKRYADDLVLSGEITPENVPVIKSAIVDAIQPFKLNMKKFAVMHHSAKPIYKSFMIKSSTRMSTNNIVNIRKMLELMFPRKVYAYSAITSGAFEGKGVIAKISGLKDKTKEEILAISNSIQEALDRTYTVTHMEVVPKFFYVQSIKQLLGVHIQDGRAMMPRRDLEELRLISMLMGRQRAIKNYQYKFSNDPQKLTILEYFAVGKPEVGLSDTFRNLLHNPMNRRVFNGKLSHIKNIDPNKFEKLVAIEEKAHAKCLEQLQEFFGRFNVII